MKKIFNYNKTGVEIADEIVDTMYSLSQKFIEHKAESAEYKEANNTVNEKFMKYCVESIPNRVFSGVEDVKNPMIHNSMYFQEAFNAILAQVITPVVPTVISAAVPNLYDTIQVGWGDNATYTVKSNEMFIVNSMAEGIARGGVQTLQNTEYSVQAKREQVSLYVDWYLVACGKLDWGEICAKVGLAFANFIQLKVVKAFQSVIENGAKHGISGYIAEGLTDENWLAVSRNVKLANGGSDVFAFGTDLALAKVLPASAATSGFRYDENSALLKTGYLPSYKNVPLYEMDNALMPNTVNGKPVSMLPDDVIYMIPVGWNKPVHVVTEGNSVTVSKDALTSVDHTYGFTVDMRIGVDVVVGTKFGAINIA